MPTIEQRFKRVRSQISHAEIAANRPRGSVALLAVSKTKSAQVVADAYRLGQRHFGESYLQEALTKQQALAGYDITWHFIGPIQSNKTRAIAAHFDWVHSVDRLKIAKRLSEQRPEGRPPLNICLQVNISGESSKSGIMLAELPRLVDEVKALPNLCLRGVMAIPEPESEYQRQRQPYRQLYQAVSALGLDELDTFSFGMSGDLKAAIAEGSTLVRIGSALFGERTTAARH
ncbi:YggS family pyridoxal phosphate-dependent enzyme [Methylomarinum sp. Ch1-1]|uniref:Pyridoxal phosphate homeostasis protein n=1 Tax=Methylomarinum roseum TaxID=3067653 RepID=A0AAU7NXH2_9GAMM|nr:YggS family pyridoxal phosphate-dependent enzyme [Methylomarinum sp. Ch1-1]MDP4522210.1 YggS family pyridoxal phosphate-dependent enzyme [Methylomarinum sp. Ch1-1]